MVPGGAQKSSGGWCEGSNPPQGVPGDHSWLTLGGSMTWWVEEECIGNKNTLNFELTHTHAHMHIAHNNVSLKMEV